MLLFEKEWLSRSQTWALQTKWDYLPPPEARQWNAARLSHVCLQDHCKSVNRQAWHSVVWCSLLCHCLSPLLHLQKTIRFLNEINRSTVTNTAKARILSSHPLQITLIWWSVIKVVMRVFLLFFPLLSSQLLKVATTHLPVGKL